MKERDKHPKLKDEKGMHDIIIGNYAVTWASQ